MELIAWLPILFSVSTRCKYKVQGCQRFATGIQAALEKHNLGRIYSQGTEVTDYTSSFMCLASTLLTKMSSLSFSETALTLEDFELHYLLTSVTLLPL